MQRTQQNDFTRDANKLCNLTVNNAGLLRCARNDGMDSPPLITASKVPK